MDPHFWAALLGIIWVDLLLSGDNALVVAMVTRQLPPAKRRIGIVFGAGAAVVLRIVFAFALAYFMAFPFVNLVGGLFLLWVAAKLLCSGDAGEDHTPSATLLGAAVTIAIADVGMSYDNVVAIAALSHGSWELMAFGVLLSIPIVILGSSLISGVIDRFPQIVWAGAAFLGWLGGGIVASDSAVLGALQADKQALHYAFAGAGLAAVLAIGLADRNARRAKAPAVAEVGA